MLEVRSLNGYINHGQNLGALAGGTVHMVLHDRVVVDAVAFIQVVGRLAVVYLHFSFHHINEFLAFMSRELEVFCLAGLYLNKEGLHVPAGFLTGQ